MMLAVIDTESDAQAVLLALPLYNRYLEILPLQSAPRSFATEG